VNKPTVGQRVTLAANEDEGWPEQDAEVVDVDELQWGTSLLVRVAPEDEGDDGLREVTLDQLQSS
jgi:hypothetical protein